jgi:hypothetical protein
LGAAGFGVGDQVGEIDVFVGGGLGDDALVIASFTELGEAARVVYFGDDGPLGFGLVDQLVEAGGVAEPGEDPNAVERSLAFEGGEDGMTPVEDIHVGTVVLGAAGIRYGMAIALVVAVAIIISIVLAVSIAIAILPVKRFPPLKGLSSPDRIPSPEEPGFKGVFAAQRWILVSAARSR